MRLQVLKHGKHAGLFDNEYDSNMFIREDPEFKNYPDLKTQSTYKIKVLVPYITHIKIVQLETSEQDFLKEFQGSSVSEVTPAFDSIREKSKMGYLKCNAHITLSTGDKFQIRVDASPREYSLEYQLRCIFAPTVWTGNITKEGYVY